MNKALPSVLITLFTLFTGSLLAQAVAVSGTVTESGTGMPLSGVTVSVSGSNTGASTDEAGRYSLSCDAGAELVFSYIGYRTLRVPVRGRTELDITLEPADEILEQVIVTGTRRPNRIQTETPAPVDVINLGPATATTGRTDITSLLNYAAPSFNYNKQSGSDGADHVDLATLRGLGPDQTLVLVNGKRRHQTAFVAVFGTRGRGNSGTDLNALPALAVDRVEILRDGASAQYGSDAIAGVINLVLREDVHRLSADIGFSGYYDTKYNPAFKPELGQYVFGDKFDGAAYTAAVNYGLPIAERGFVNLTLNYANTGKTFRQELDGELPVNIYRRAHGDASMQALGAFLNAEVPIGQVTLYAFGGVNRKDSDAYAFTRNFSARPERFPTDANGNLIPVPGIIRTAADGESYFNPRILTDVTDYSAAAGIRGMTNGGWAWDLSNAFGYNDFHFFGDKTFNASLGPSPNSFDDGGFRFTQNTVNLNVSRGIPRVLSGFNLAFGAELRLENYRLYAGEETSWRNYNSAKASGAQGFPGYQPADEADAGRTTLGAYGDVELDLTERWLLSGAVRLENYSDFGFTSTFKLATRYKLPGNFNLRGSLSTGFRAPSLQQINFSSTFTTVQGGQIAEVKIAPNDNPITRAAGIPELTEERSVNASVGFSWKPARELTVTVDAYQVNVTDRVVLSGQFDATDTTLDPKLTDALQNLRVSLAQFFANAVNTTNRGIDFVFDYNKRLTNGGIRALLTANIQNMTIDEINVPAGLDDTPAHRLTFLSDREQSFILASAPKQKFALNLEYETGKLTFGTRLTYFGRITLPGYGEDGLGINPQVPTDADPNVYVADRYVYGGKLVPDLYTAVQLSPALRLNLGVDNFLNVHPDLGYVPVAAGWAFNNETGGPWDAVQMGGNGARLFARLGWRL